MTTKQPIGGAIATVLDEIQAATRRLIRAARAGEAEVLLEAMEQRGLAVERLREAFETPEGRSLDPGVRRELLDSLSIQAQEAESELRGMRERALDDLRTLSRGARVMRGYAAYSGESSALDRSG